ncbi:MAG TPA: hypothetical protein PLQ93_09210 [Bacteroidia bacterium]|nr:hypothetical protein [Bacteroidia bacterium]
MLRRVTIRLVLVLIFFVVLDRVYTYTLFPRDMENLSPEILEIRKTQAETDLYYFAESSNFSTKKGDSIQNSISEISHLFFPRLKFTAINKPASHAGTFLKWLNEIDPSESKLKALVVTLNMRSFNAAWIHSKMEAQLQESLVFTYPFPNLFNRFLLSLKIFDNITEQQRDKLLRAEWQNEKISLPHPSKYKTVLDWDFAMAHGGHLKSDGTWDVAKSTLACHYIKAYALTIREDNPRIKDFDNIVQWCEKNRIKLYLNLMAENVQYADSLVGKDLVYLMHRNRDFLMKRYNKGICSVVDNMDLVPGKEFTDQDWTTEHYGYKGRMIVGKNLAKHLKQQFNNYYYNAY